MYKGMAVNVEMTWRNNHGNRGYPHENTKRRLRIVSEDERVHIGFPWEKVDNRNNCYDDRYNTKGKEINCSRTSSNEEDQKDLRLFLQDKQREKKASDDWSTYTSPQTKEAGDNYDGYKGRNEKWQYGDKQICHDRMTKIQEASRKEAKKARQLSPDYTLKHVADVRKKKIQNNIPKLQKLGSKEKRKHSYKEEVARKEKEIQELIEQKSREREVSEAQSKKVRIITKTEKTYETLNDIHEKGLSSDINHGLNRKVVDAYMKCKEENDDCIVKVAQFEKSNIQLKKKVVKHEQKIQKLKRKLVNEQMESKNYKTKIDELEGEIKELQIEANAQAAWTRAVKGISKPTYEKTNSSLSNSMYTECGIEQNKTNDLPKMLDESEEHSRCTSPCSSKLPIFTSTPCKHGELLQANSTFECSECPIQSSKPAAYKVKLDYEPKRLSVITEEEIEETLLTKENEHLVETSSANSSKNKYDNEEMYVTVQSVPPPICKVENKSTVKHGNGELMHIFRSEMQAAEELWETEIKWEDEMWQLEANDTSLLEDKSKTSMTGEGATPNKINTENELLSNSTRRNNCNEVRPNLEAMKEKFRNSDSKSNEFKILSALKANDPIIQANVSKRLSM